MKSKSAQAKKSRAPQAKRRASAKAPKRQIQPAATKPVKTTLGAIRRAVKAVINERGGARA